MKLEIRIRIQGAQGSRIQMKNDKPYQRFDPWNPETLEP
jgi:hypothetical protein